METPLNFSVLFQEKEKKLLQRNGIQLVGAEQMLSNSMFGMEFKTE